MKWTKQQVLKLFELPFLDVMHKAHQVHREHFPKQDIQISTLFSIKTGSCPEDCKYCPQSAHYNTAVKKESLMDINIILEQAKFAKINGAERFCMGAAWRSLHDRDLPQITEIIKQVKLLGLETCLTLGMLTKKQASILNNAGLDYYNHNLDTSENYYKEIITTRTYADRLETLQNVRDAGIKVCCGGIIGMGEKLEDRADLLVTLANLDPYPESVPINLLVKVKGTPLGNSKDIDIFEFIKTIAAARIIMPKARVRLSAGRNNMSEEAQVLCFMAGANSIFYGAKLLTTKNPEMEKDLNLLKKLGLNAT
ncbi:biotin synthase BioB [Rickettsiales endosymbiont of Stachyamoeba lipophora]|uniref:biotin synthase BioB n=1 Tax=Rickettsiales endosymbiont of Stachyamoeba lipophora TaxID=2486578 RepID=UPI000F64E7E4|nr:biotin synthase BioB [Rickettsiales endosymbiont of Stachyamoeba lipophora]AZL16075.1 biotin synthase BioB [Rickettsiales endosymbiont of Stachyamoeba lipophora]